MAGRQGETASAGNQEGKGQRASELQLCRHQGFENDITVALSMVVIYKSMLKARIAEKQLTINATHNPTHCLGALPPTNDSFRPPPPLTSQLAFFVQLSPKQE